MIFVAIIAVLTVAVPRFVFSDSNGRIFGGHEVDIENIPYQISLQYNGFHICGGSLISENFVLTAAHCVYGKLSWQFKVRLGSSYHKSGGNVIEINKIHIHPYYVPIILHYDIALLQLRINNQTKFNLQFASLPKEDEHIADGESLRVSGWGNTEYQNGSSNKLRAVNVYKINHKKCNEFYKYFGGITSRMLCAGHVNGKQDSCQGDSGSPLTCGDTLVGIVSWGAIGCALPNYPGVYTQVSAHRYWIRFICGI